VVGGGIGKKGKHPSYGSLPRQGKGVNWGRGVNVWYGTPIPKGEEMTEAGGKKREEGEFLMVDEEIQLGATLPEMRADCKRGAKWSERDFRKVSEKKKWKKTMRAPSRWNYVNKSKEGK